MWQELTLRALVPRPTEQNPAMPAWPRAKPAYPSSQAARSCLLDDTVVDQPPASPGTPTVLAGAKCPCSRRQ